MKPETKMLLIATAEGIVIGTFVIFVLGVAAYLIGG